MRTLYLELNMGAAGDIINASLFELLSKDEKEKYLDKMNMIFPEKISVKAEKAEKCGIIGTHMCVLIKGIEEGHVAYHDENHKHEEHKLEDIKEIINSIDISDKVKSDAINIYMLIADAEANVHGRDVEEIHFHEVGALDAVCDVIGASLLLEMIDLESNGNNRHNKNIITALHVRENISFVLVISSTLTLVAVLPISLPSHLVQ